MPIPKTSCLQHSLCKQVKVAISYYSSLIKNSIAIKYNISEGSIISIFKHYKDFWGFNKLG